MISGTRIADALQMILNIGLVCLSIILIVFLGRQTFDLARVLLNAGEQSSTYLLIEGIVTYFLYFEFIALIGFVE